MWRAFGPRFLFRLLASGFWLLLSADTIDRIAITVGNQVITESQVEDEVRVTAFLNGDQPDLSAAGKKQAAARLIEQALVKREMEFSRYPLPALSDAGASLQELKKRYPDEAAFQQALKDSRITEDGLAERLRWQLTVLRFVDYRFRPGIQISDADIQAYYQQQLPKWRQQGVQTLLGIEEVRNQIEEILTQQRIDENLDQWLAETRTQVSIRYRDEALQ
jgi:peptidyl-prolyl cis-trans isomerase SurA